MLSKIYQTIGKTVVFSGLAYGGYTLATDRNKRKQVGDTIEHTVDDPQQAARDLHKAAKQGVRRGREMVGGAIDKNIQEKKASGDSIWNGYGWFSSSKDNTAKDSSDNSHKPPRP